MTTDFAIFLSTSQAAGYLGLSRQRVDQLIQRGEIASQVVADRRVIHRSELDIWQTKRQPSGQVYSWQPRTLRELQFKRDVILALADKYGLANVRVIGSFAGRGGEPVSDVEFLVTSLERTTAADAAEFCTDVEDQVGRRVAVVVDSDLSPATPALSADAAAL